VNGKHAVVERLFELGAEVKDDYRRVLAEGLAGKLSFASATQADYERLVELLDRLDGTG
jgi:hypothetical protein